jgi:hypothetical protein
VHVHVQAAWQDQRAGRVELPAAARRPAELGDLAVADREVTFGGTTGGHHGAAADHEIEVWV